MTDQDEDSRIGAYAPPADEFQTFDAREEESRRGTLLLTTAIFVIVLFAAVVYKAFDQGTREREAAPRIVADVEPYRERPADPGGEETRDTELDVYNRLSGDNAEPEAVQPRPIPEEPLEESRPALRVETVTADATQEPAPAAVDTAPEVTPRQAPERPATQPPAPQPQTQTTPAPQAEPEPVAAQPARTVVDPAPASTRADGVSATGGWVVQIASFREASEAEAAWLAFQGRFSDIASGLGPDIQTAEIEGRGTYHRLRIAAFTTRDAATAFCATLQSRGQDCLVRSR
ncbi:SPOR domain-containing protein [Maricaulis sp.]|uniref:SPOR domain-containing protein n=1 Tax=Maricaulis sp. TaxID=1486257 RepID=UPI00262A190E|nr:SPOR domain-containing protein [Maricaulis sp.]